MHVCNPPYQSKKHSMCKIGVHGNDIFTPFINQYQRAHGYQSQLMKRYWWSHKIQNEELKKKKKDEKKNYAINRRLEEVNEFYGIWPFAFGPKHAYTQTERDRKTQTHVHAQCICIKMKYNTHSTDRFLTGNSMWQKHVLLIARTVIVSYLLF